MGGVRTLTVWCPDWPVAALGVPPDRPAVVLASGRVVAGTAAARADGVRRGLRRREAQARCPELLVLDRDEMAEARAFEPVVAALAGVCPRVEVVRPGLAAFATKGPARYFGGDAALVTVVTGTVVDALGSQPRPRAGVADGPFAAALAAREHRIVPAGGSPAYLAPFPVAVLGRPELADLLVRLGVRTLGEFAALPRRQVASRFGADGVAAHRLARGLDERPLFAGPPPEDLSVQLELDPPADRIEPAAFAAKALADRLHARLAAHGLAAARVLIEAETEYGERLARLWRHDGHGERYGGEGGHGGHGGRLTAAAVAERVRWQLAGWLTAPVAERPSGGIALLRLTPDALHADVGDQLALWGGGTDADERAARALARVQGLLGPDAVLTAVLAGGRGPAEQIRLVPWGEPPPAAYDGSPPWPGTMPAPAPATVHPDPLPAELVDATGQPVVVDGRARVSAPPARLRVGGRGVATVVAWAGPWPADEAWWDPAAHRRCARVQVLTDDGTARLLAVEAGHWHVEATYD